MFLGHLSVCQPIPALQILPSSAVDHYLLLASAAHLPHQYHEPFCLGKLQSVVHVSGMYQTFLFLSMRNQKIIHFVST